MKYIITIQRIECRETSFEVEAESSGKAEIQALENCCDFDFSQCPIISADEEIISTIIENDLERILKGTPVS